MVNTVLMYTVVDFQAYTITRNKKQTRKGFEKMPSGIIRCYRNNMISSFNEGSSEMPQHYH